MNRTLIICTVASFTAAVVHSYRASAPSEPERAYEVAFLLRVVGGDYLEAVEGAYSEEDREHVLRMLDTAAAASESLEGGAQYAAEIGRVKLLAETWAQPWEVNDEARRIAAQVMREHDVRGPDALPSLADGRKVYESACAACHGANGDTRSAPVRGLDPAPPSFVEMPTVASLSPVDVYGAVTFGVPGTAMPSFALLSDEERWAVAFYVFSLRHSACSERGDAPSIDTLATLTDQDLVARFGESRYPCLRLLTL
jgi:high-affinity iron transporter